MTKNNKRREDIKVKVNIQSPIPAFLLCATVLQKDVGMDVYLLSLLYPPLFVCFFCYAIPKSFFFSCI